LTVTEALAVFSRSLSALVSVAVLSNWWVPQSAWPKSSHEKVWS